MLIFGFIFSRMDWNITTGIERVSPELAAGVARITAYGLSISHESYILNWQSRGEIFFIEFARSIRKPDPEEYVDSGNWKARQGGQGMEAANRGYCLLPTMRRRSSC